MYLYRGRSIAADITEAGGHGVPRFSRWPDCTGLSNYRALAATRKSGASRFDLEAQELGYEQSPRNSPLSRRLGSMKWGVWTGDWRVFRVSPKMALL